MQHLFAPWRMAYIAAADAARECIFCNRGEDGDPTHVVSRSAHVYMILNAFPYTAGHLMVCPYRHVGRFGDLVAGERRELFTEARRASAALRTVYRPEAIHVGANLGRAAGAGVIGHVHLHLVPVRAADRLDDPDRPGASGPPEPLEESFRKLAGTLGGGR